MTAKLYYNILYTIQQAVQPSLYPASGIG